jgi:trichoplein keratin filament-binding protein
MIELKQREAESEVIKREEAQLMSEKLSINHLEEQRHAMWEKNSRQDYGRQLLRQHKAKLRQRTKEIQEELEFDLKILRVINEATDEQKHLDAAKRLKAKAEAEQMIQVLNQQLRVEKEREAELEAMFQDEAQKEWDKKNEIWKRESMAREALMRQVLDERQKQLDEKFQLLNEKKLDSLRKREDLLRDMEKTQLMVVKEKEKLERNKLERKRELEEQMTSRKENVFKEDVVHEVDNYEQEQIQNENYKNFVENEKVKKLETKFEPKVR